MHTTSASSDGVIMQNTDSWPECTFVDASINKGLDPIADGCKSASQAHAVKKLEKL